MGLLKARVADAKKLMVGASHWQIAVGLVLICLVLASFGDDGRALLRYDRLEIENGESWRLLTGHFVHLSTSHLVLNLAGLVLVWLLVGRFFDRLGWLLILLATIALTTAGFWFIDQHLLWYVGLSGVLHGLLVAGAYRGLKELPTESAIILFIVASKLAYEQLMGPMPGSESVSGGSVVVNAHLFGAIGGFAAALVYGRREAAPASI